MLLVKTAGNSFSGIGEYSDCQSVGVPCLFSGLDEELVHPATVVIHDAAYGKLYAQIRKRRDIVGDNRKP